MCRSKKTLLIVCCLTAFIVISTYAFAGNKVFYSIVTPFQNWTVYTVPQGKKFVLKSLVITNVDASAASVFINTTGKILFALRVGGLETFVHNFQSIVIKSGKELIVHNTSTTNLRATVTGVLK